ncbi:gas vesicle protein GvpN [Ectothiorhodospira haloalkaliphila]|uniref:gas vesicle protein GvpN n=1 Tax=Ectothiorhodospira haloalkaliphila TaxID=421628 RepID=UPI001EE7DF73|nr:gas vesicle protein GvpN [Ectothiorhodospira haloalkaliphila]MCG5526127.1 gas vesicle protein GvpN [Ectothiorhodospira haloalkaliphila]
MGSASELTLLNLDKSEGFIETPYIKDITERALDYTRAGYAVHFCGPAGTGKTVLALHVAAQLGRQVVLIHGDDEFGSSDLVGSQSGYRTSSVLDNYISSVVKREERVTRQWVDNRLTSACKYGLTLIYDEFTRSRPEANNVLLSVLEERLLNLPGVQKGDNLLQVHPDFTAIFTSNPEEYAGVHKTQDALLDRMFTLKIDHPDLETEVRVTQSSSGLPEDQARAIVSLVRAFRQVGVNNARPTIRACLMIARVLAMRGGTVDAADPRFRQLCHDVMGDECVKVRHDDQDLGCQVLDELIDEHCRRPRKRKPRASRKSNSTAKASSA